LRLAPGSTNNVGGGDGSGERFLSVRRGLMVLSSGPGFRLGGRPRWAAGHPFAAAGGGMMGFAVHLAGGVNQKRDHAK
jgi:hypothetical protein